MAKIHSKSTRIYVDDADISGSSAAVEIGLARPLGEVTAFTDTGRKHLGGVAENVGSIEAIYDDAAGESDEPLSDLLGAERAVSLWPSGDAPSAIGYGQGAIIGRKFALVSRVGEVVKASADIEFNGQADRLKSLTAKRTAVVTYTGTAIDDAAATTAGGVWIYHVFAFSATGGNARWQLVIEDSADNVAWATVGAESVNILAVGAGRRAFTGTLRRYVKIRANLDAITGSLTFQVSYQRL